VSTEQEYHRKGDLVEVAEFTAVDVRLTVDRDELLGSV